MKKIIEYLPLLTIGVVFGGYLKLSWYFSFFEIKISPFLDNSEILLSFFDDLYLIISAALFYFYQVIMHHLEDFKKLLGKELHEETTQSQDKNKHWKLFLKILGIFTGIYFIYNFFEDPTKVTSLTFFFLYSSAIFFTIMFLDMFFENTKFEILSIIVGNVIVFFFLIYCISYRQAHIVYKNAAEVSNKFIIGKDTISSSRTYFYIGQTNRYVFLFDAISKRTDIIPIGKIDKYELNIKANKAK